MAINTFAPIHYNCPALSSALYFGGLYCKQYGPYRDKTRLQVHQSGFQTSLLIYSD